MRRLVWGVLVVMLMVPAAFAGDRWVIYNTGNSGLVDDYVGAIAIDADGNKWFGTWGDGVSALHSDGSWTTYNTANSGLADNYVGAIAIEANGNKWFGTLSGGVSVLHSDGSWQTYNTANSGLAGDFVGAIAIDADGNKWFATYERGVSVLRPDGSWTAYNKNNSGLADNVVSDIAVDPDGNKWFGTWPVSGYESPSGVSVLNSDGSWTTYNRGNSGLANNGVLVIAIDADGNRWFGTNGGGVSVLHPDASWTTYNSFNSGLAYNWVYAIAFEANGNKWLGTDGEGVSVLHPDASWTTYNTANSGLAGDYVAAIAIDTNDSKWFGTSDGGGVSVLTQMPVISVATNQSRYHLDEEMIVQASLENPGPAITVDVYLGVGLPDGTLLSWSAFAKGLVPAFASFTIPASFSFGPSKIFDTNLPGLSAGNYFWFAGMTKPRHISQTVGDVAIAPWRFE